MSSRLIWMYWDQGLNNAPDLVRICVESWQRQNPDWTVRVLDEASVPNFVGMTDVRNRNPRLTVQAYSDILRWRLLAQHGGVWADSTLYCAAPLDSWLANHITPKGFFAFRSPEAFLYHSWLLVGNPDNPIVKGMNREIDRFFVKYSGYRHYWELRGIWRLYRLLEQWAGRYNYEIWRSHIFRRYFKAAPYFFQNYLTGAVLRRNSDASSEFGSLKISYGECPHALQNMTKPHVCPSLAAVRELLDSSCPVQKLTTKRHIPEWTTGGVLNLLDGYGRY